MTSWCIANASIVSRQMVAGMHHPGTSKTVILESQTSCERPARSRFSRAPSGARKYSALISLTEVSILDKSGVAWFTVTEIAMGVVQAPPRCRVFTVVRALEARSLNAETVCSVRMPMIMWERSSRRS